MFWNKISIVVATNIAVVLLKVFSCFTLTNVEMPTLVKWVSKDNFES